MRAILATATILAAVTLTANAADVEKFKSKDGKFTVAFPAGEKVKTNTKKSGELDMNFSIVEIGKEKAFIVMYMDLPEAVKNVPSKTLLDGVEKGSVAESGGKLESSKDIEFGKGKLPGRENIVDKDGNKIKSWAIIDGTRVYVVVVGGPKDFATGKDGTAFLKSFEITK